MVFKFREKNIFFYLCYDFLRNNYKNISYIYNFDDELNKYKQPIMYKQPIIYKQPIMYKQRII
jgi:hypothetical protein